MNNTDMLDEIDRLIHEPARLKIMALLCVLDSADFIFVMNQTGLTWGNLSAHLSKLNAGDYIEMLKTYHGRKPATVIRLTEQGRAAFQIYRRQMQHWLDTLPD